VLGVCAIRLEVGAEERAWIEGFRPLAELAATAECP